MKPNIDQITVTSVVVQIMQRIKFADDFKDGEFIDYIEGELSNLNGILTPIELAKLQDYIQEMYLLIKNINNG